MCVSICVSRVEVCHMKTVDRIVKTVDRIVIEVVSNDEDSCDFMYVCVSLADKIQMVTYAYLARSIR